MKKAVTRALAEGESIGHKKGMEECRNTGFEEIRKELSGEFEQDQSDIEARKQEGYSLGREEGREQGREEGNREFFERILSGDYPADVAEVIEKEKLSAFEEGRAIGHMEGQNKNEGEVNILKRNIQGFFLQLFVCWCAYSILLNRFGKKISRGFRPDTKQF